MSVEIGDDVIDAIKKAKSDFEGEKEGEKSPATGFLRAIVKSINVEKLVNTWVKESSSSILSYVKERSPKAYDQIVELGDKVGIDINDQGQLAKFVEAIISKSDEDDEPTDDKYAEIKMPYDDEGDEEGEAKSLPEDQDKSDGDE